MYKQAVGESALTGMEKTIGGGNPVPVPRKNLYKLLLIHFIPECKKHIATHTTFQHTKISGRISSRCMDRLPASKTLP